MAHKTFLYSALAAISLVMLPRADTLYIIARSTAQGQKAGVVSVLGISTGSLLHTTAAAFGLSAILATSAIAFTIVKSIGAVYLVYLGIMIFISKNASTDIDLATKDKNLWAIYRQGILTNILNPKVALFFLAFLPQFVVPAAGYQMLSFFFLGCLFVSTNIPAINLWHKLGFEIVGTVPQAFNHQHKGIVDAHIMFREL